MSSASRGHPGRPNAAGSARTPRGESLLAPHGPLQRAARLRRRAEFLRAQSRGIRLHTPAFTIIVVDGVEGATGARLGCAVSKRVGNAVVRNRIRRLLKEVFRRTAVRLAAVDIVVVAKPPAKALAQRGLEAVARTLVPALEEGSRRAQNGRAK